MNKIFWLIIITTLVLLTGIFFLFKKPAIKNDEVVFWTLQMSDFAPYINGVIDEFESQNPNVKIKWVDVPFSEGEKRTLASVLSDNPPDLVNLNPDFSATLAHKGALFEIPQEKLEQFNEISFDKSLFILLKPPVTVPSPIVLISVVPNVLNRYLMFLNIVDIFLNKE